MTQTLNSTVYVYFTLIAALSYASPRLARAWCTMYVPDLPKQAKTISKLEYGLTFALTITCLWLNDLNSNLSLPWHAYLMLLLCGLASTDWRTCRLPAALIYILVLSCLIHELTYHTLAHLCERVIASFILVALLWCLSYLLSPKDHQDALGHGDLWTLGALNLYLGWASTWLLIWFAALLTVIHHLCMYGQQRQRTLPWLPYLALSYWFLVNVCPFIV